MHRYKGRLHLRGGSLEVNLRIVCTYGKGEVGIVMRGGKKQEGKESEESRCRCAEMQQVTMQALRGFPVFCAQVAK